MCRDPRVENPRRAAAAAAKLRPWSTSTIPVTRVRLPIPPCSISRRALGPNVLWLTEALCDVMALEPGMARARSGLRACRELDLPRAQLGVQVVAADLWISPTETWRRIVEAGCESQVIPLHAEAHELKFAHGYFDAIVSLDAYHYFGGDAAYLGTLTPFLRPGGQLGIVVPGVRDEGDRLPPHLEPFVFEGYNAALHRLVGASTGSCSGLVTVERADWIDDGWTDWRVVERDHARGGRSRAFPTPRARRSRC